MHLVSVGVAGIIAGVKHRSVSLRRSHSSPEERQQWVERFYNSNLSQREFAVRHGIGLSTLQRWVSQSSGAHTVPAFAEVKLPQGSPRWAAELVHSDGTVLRLAHDVPTALLEQLLLTC